MYHVLLLCYHYHNYVHDVIHCISSTLTIVLILTISIRMIYISTVEYFPLLV